MYFPDSTNAANSRNFVAPFVSMGDVGVEGNVICWEADNSSECDCNCAKWIITGSVNFSGGNGTEPEWAIWRLVVSSSIFIWSRSMFGIRCEDVNVSFGFLVRAT